MGRKERKCDMNEKMTNGDRIRELPNEVLAQIIRQCCYGSNCIDCPMEQPCNGVFRTTDDWFDWLESEAEESHE